MQFTLCKGFFQWMTEKEENNPHQTSFTAAQPEDLYQHKTGSKKGGQADRPTPLHRPCSHSTASVIGVDGQKVGIGGMWM